MNFKNNSSKVIVTLSLLGGLIGTLELRAEGPTITGFVDTQFTTNFNQPLSGSTALRSYDAEDNNITLNVAHLEFTGTLEDVTYNVQLDAGSDAEVNNILEGADPANPSFFNLQEAYLAYSHPATSLGYKVGKFVTFMGIEVVEPKDNPTITRGYLYNLAEPVSHTGGVATYKKGIFDVALGAVNGFDVTSDNNTDKTIIGKLATSFGDPLFLNLSFADGSEQATFDSRDRTTVDLTGVSKIISKLALNFQGLYGQERHYDGASMATWKGVGFQPVYSLSDRWSIGARAEYMEDPQGLRTATSVPTYVRNFSIAPAFTVTKNSVIRLEYRYDSANTGIWENDKGDLKGYARTLTTEFYVTF